MKHRKKVVLTGTFSYRQFSHKAYGVRFWSGTTFVNLGNGRFCFTKQPDQQITCETAFKNARSVIDLNVKIMKSQLATHQTTKPPQFENDVPPLTYRDAIIKNYGIGILTIPQVAMTLPILAGVSKETMAVGVVTVKPNEQAGQRNFALVGHNMTERGNLLHNLTNVKVGAKIKITTKRGQYNYQVTAVYHGWPLACNSKILSRSDIV